MDDNRKAIAVQWLVPAGILLMVIAIMLFNFTTKSRLSANDTVTRNMTDAASACADNFREQLTLLTTIGEPVTELMEDKTSLESIYALKVIRLVMRYSGAYAVCMLDENGKGIDNTGEKISMAELPTFLSNMKKALDICSCFTR